MTVTRQAYNLEITFTKMFNLCSAQLKLLTVKAHQETENILLPVIQNIKNTEAYIAVLQMMYGFYYPLEKKFSQYITADILPDIEQRHKSSFAKNDIENLAANSQGIIAGVLPAISNTAQAFGAMYVLEGSTLGSVYIAKMLKKKSPAFSQMQMCFFNSYGEKTGTMWKYFKDVMDNYLQHQHDIDKAIITANETFEAMKIWIINYPHYTKNISSVSRC